MVRCSTGTGNGSGFADCIVDVFTNATAYGGYPDFTLLLMYDNGNGTGAIHGGFGP